MVSSERPALRTSGGTCCRYGACSFGAATATRTCWRTPFVARKLRAMRTMSLPRHCITRRGSFVTTATRVASRFSASACRRNAGTSCGASTTAMRSCDSEIASSVPSSPSYFFGTASRSIVSPSASSPMATATPPAPKSLHRLIRQLTSGLRNSRCSFRSVGGLPFCTSAPEVVSDCSVCCFDEPVAPPMPSRPVRPPSRIMTSPGTGRSRTTCAAGAAPITAPISMRLAR